MFVFFMYGGVVKNNYNFMGGGINLCNYFCTFAVRSKKYICKNIESPF